ncbi:hypothetical protein [Empedobacter sedimenti]|uniref:hypothetical protein n=1 Tax=Empedobacter sedimenti TaxID=3042610 RepID=UPI0024A792F7|nr:hypothetical protein [Empedobacter sedimenti]
MKTFDINKYNDWEKDLEITSSDNHLFYKKGENIAEINFYKNYIQEILYDLKSPYKTYNGYDIKTNKYKGGGKTFYQFLNIGKWLYYDESGKLIKEVDYDKPYNLSIEDVDSIIKKNTDLDIMKPIQIYEFSRTINKPYLYLIAGHKDGWRSHGKLEGFVIDDKTGKIIFKTDVYTEGKGNSLMQQYSSFLNNSSNNNNIYKEKK